ncbi:MAG: TetR/AcrR family transcriptional regulator [Armatimonadota bacterium]|nr:TetR family transcriptional regulator [bacterium]MDW8104432.1 TetR/AcrR family transcriptional regulator [Armatimonadota bacterium]MDW8289695.1 TetR/AcrR family transcriptional regulator [Armatimonadota bacterium]
MQEPQTSQKRPTARDRIMRAAEALFAERGFDATSIGEIALRAHVNRALLYYYFEHKEDLYHALLREGIDKLYAAVSQAVNLNASAREALQTFLRSYLQIAQQHPGLVRIVYREIVGTRRDDEEGQNLVRRFMQTLLLLEQVLRRGVHQGEIQPHDTTKSVYMLLGMVNVFVTLSYLEQSSYPAEEIVEHVLRVFFEGLATR